MKILVTAAQGKVFERHFPKDMRDALALMGEVEYNPYTRPFTREELAQRLADTDIVVTHWGTPQIDAQMLDGAPRLKLIAHAAGTVAHIASEAFYERGIPVLSANSVMAGYVAEGVLGYMLCGCRHLLQLDASTRQGKWERRLDEAYSMLGGEIGLIGLGTVGRRLLELLRPFRCTVHVYDPYVVPEALAAWPFAHLCSFEEAMSQRVVSVHAAQTPETYHMIDARALSMLPDGGVLINSARGSLVDTKALIAQLQAGRIYAVLDVYEEEGEGKLDPALLSCRAHSVLLPHVAGGPAGAQMTQAIIDDMGRFLRGEEMQLKISLAQYRLMTQE